MDRSGSIAEAATTRCIANLFKLAFNGYDLKPVRSKLLGQIQSDHVDATSLIDLCVIEQLLGDEAAGLQRQAEALSLQRLYRSYWPTSSRALHVLAFMAPGPVGTNTPIEFLLEDTDVVLHMLYVVPGQPVPTRLPNHDIAIVIACESDRNRPVLQEIERLIPTWPCPVLNHPVRILDLSRERMYSFLQTVRGTMMPATIRVNRVTLGQIERGLTPICQLLGETTFPLIVRPTESHAGRGLAKLDVPSSISAYLADQRETEFFLSRFVDYRSSDGLFRKYRIVWVDGRPYPGHMAISDDWKVWYYNAGMAASAAKRDEEAGFMSTFDTNFARRHSAALAAITEQFGLEYFGVDCAELPGGRLLVFEGDIALAVHDMDSPTLYPYKGVHMQRLFAAFRDMLKCKSTKDAVCV